MPRRTGRKAQGDWTTGYKIPETIAPENFVEFCFRLPDEPYYLDAFWQHMDKLSFWHAWEHYLKTGAKDYRAKEVAQFWGEHVYLVNRDRYELGQGCGGAECEECNEDTCLEYLPNNAWIKFLPTDPFAGKNAVSPGYIQNPFLVAKEGDLAGLQPGDVYVVLPQVMLGITPFNFIPKMIQRLSSGGLPRFQFTFVGKGEVELHLIDMPQGGMFWIRELGTTKPGFLKASSSIDVGDYDDWVDALVELLGLAITGEVFASNIIELEFDTTGEHKIEVVFLPRLGFPDVFETGWGGGLHKIVACGGTIKQATTKPPVIRPGEGGLEYEEPATGEWLPIPGSSVFIECVDCDCDCEDNDLGEC